MSERINVDQAFDPEARKAQADFDAYMDSRPYKDDNGRVHDAETGNFANLDAVMEQRRADHYDDSLTEGDYSNESLEQLAQRVADARAEGDTTRANDAEEAFFEKFNAYAEKYGWEDEKTDETATGQLAVDKNAKIGRDTIDARLERYGKIMYGETETEAQSKKEQEPEAPASDTTESSVETPEPVTESDVAGESAEAETTTAAETEAEEATEPEAAPVTVDDEIAAAQQRLNEAADARAQKVIDDMNSTDQAKADRELLEPISVEGLDPIEDNGLDSRVETEALDPIDTTGLEDIDDEDASDEVQERSRWRRIGARMSPAALAARLQTNRYYRQRDRERTQERNNNRKALLALGVVGAGLTIGGIYLANKYGLDFNGHHGGNVPQDGFKVPRGDGVTYTTGGHGGGNGLNWNDFDPSAQHVTRGEGFYSTFQQMGIPKEHWADTLNAAGPKLQKLGEAYYDNGAKEWRISEPGNLSRGALRVIAASARKDGVEL